MLCLAMLAVEAKPLYNCAGTPGERGQQPECQISTVCRPWKPSF